VPERLRLTHRLALGDTLLMTSLVRDIHRAYPGRFAIEPNTTWTPVWQHNPHITTFETDARPEPRNVVISYAEGIVESGRGRKIHMLAWFHEDFRRKTGLEVPVTEAGGDLHLSAAERAPRLEGRYWLVLSGGKLDLTAKWWAAERFQQTVDILSRYGLRFAQVGATHSAHVHPPLRGVTNLIGQTDDVRDLFSLIAGADGVLCGVTGAMHIAAALRRPCVVVAGGREEPWWEAYTAAYGGFGLACPPPAVPHRYLHTLGLLDCCPVKGCWKSRVVPIMAEDHTAKGKRRLCGNVVRPTGGQVVPRCLDMVSVDHAVEAVLSYYADGTLPTLR